MADQRIGSVAWSGALERAGRAEFSLSSYSGGSSAARMANEAPGRILTQAEARRVMRGPRGRGAAWRTAGGDWRRGVVPCVFDEGGGDE
jgi:hypothetical protein